MKSLPSQLKNTNFRFFLVGRNGKKPIEKKWNTLKNYPYFHTDLLNHLKGGGNIGIVTGIHNIIVLDFDDWDFYVSVKDKLPKTFTVKTAKSKKPHYYYILKGEMIKKVGVDDDKRKRLMDIQADRCGIICPPSTINRTYYVEYTDRPIATITIEELKALFNIKPRQPSVYTGGEIECDDKAVLESIKLLEQHHIKRTKERHFVCPFHPSTGQANLWVGNDGILHCFHCGFHGDVHYFIDELREWKR